MRNEDIAKLIVSKTIETTSGLTVSDNFPFADRGASLNHQKYTMSDDFAANGCVLTLGNTSRVYGWKQLRSRLQGVDGFPLIYFTESCVQARNYLPALPYHPSDSKPEDAAESGESTHACDAIRLGCTCRPLIKDEPKPKGPIGHGITSMTPTRILDKFKRQSSRTILR